MFEELIRYFGSQRDLAEALGVSTSAVSQWFTNKHIPVERLVDIDLATDGIFETADMVLQQRRIEIYRGTNKYPIPDDEDIEIAIANNPLPNAYHKHPSCVKACFAYLDAQIKTKRYGGYGGYAGHLKHLVERWAGFYVSRHDLAIAAILHPDVKGEYPDFNISQRAVLPCFKRLEGIENPSPGDSYRLRPEDYSKKECPEELEVS